MKFCICFISGRFIIPNTLCSFILLIYFLWYLCPTFRIRKFIKTKILILSLNVCIEPVGSVAPKLTSGDKSRTLDIRRNHNLTLLCPAQSYPVPNFRWVKLKLVRVFLSRTTGFHHYIFILSFLKLLFINCRAD